MARTKIYLKSGKEQSLKRYHPWIFSGAIAKIDGKAGEGDLVDVYDPEGTWLATGHYQKSSIAVRILSFEPEDFDQAFWDRRIGRAWKLRTEAGLTGSDATTVFRIVNGEGDDLPGLIIDFYSGTAVFQAHSAGMYLSRDAVVSSLMNLPGNPVQAVYDKSTATLPFKSGLHTTDGYLEGKAPSDELRENGYLFTVDWEQGQKTGFFIDQRENRRLLEKYSGKRKVLNLFGYTGGFSVYALGGGASLVHTVDASERAVSMAERNVALNFSKKVAHRSFAADAFDFMEKSDEQYDLIILDPPAFAKHRKVLANALQGYKKLNRRAIELVASGGIIFTFSCSQVVSRDEFRKSVFAAAANTGRRVRILHQMFQPADHPVSIYHPEGEYLKGLVLHVEDACATDHR